MEKWANHLISAIRYSPDHKYTTELVQHEDEDDSISEGAIVNKLDVTDGIKKGKSYMTIFNSNDNWKIGEKIKVFMVDGEVFIRTDKNKVERDNLGLLPEIWDLFLFREVIVKVLEIAYLLIQCDLGAETEIIKKLAEISEVKEVRGTYGVYDIFAKLESDSRQRLDEILTNNIRMIPRIRSTNTLSPILSQGGR